MKKLIFTLTMLLVMTTAARAMSYEQARNQALFLADKMAYELNLTEEQYEAAYEINLDYLMGVNSYDDLYGPYWRQRNLDLSYVLLDWQYNAFCAASYFYRPLYWSDGYWHFGIYSRYPHRNYFYYGRPSFINVYVGGHSWRSNGGRSWYHGRDWGKPAPGTANHGNVHFGMRDGFKRGDYNKGFDYARSNRQQGDYARNNRQQGSNQVNSNFGGARPGNNSSSANSNFGARRNDNQSARNTQNTSRSGNSSFGGARQSSTPSTTSRSNFGARESSTRTTVRNSGSSSNFSTRSSSSQTPANSFMPSNRSSQSSSRSSFGGGSTGGSRSNTSGGGGHFGGRR